MGLWLWLGVGLDFEFWLGLMVQDYSGIRVIGVAGVVGVPMSGSGWLEGSGVTEFWLLEY